jgi:hypothetical protein
MVITPDNRTLIISESFAGRLAAFGIDADEGLSNRRAFAEGLGPDGICPTPRARSGLAPPTTRSSASPGGEVLQRVELRENRAPFALMLGRPDRYWCAHPPMTNREMGSPCADVNPHIGGGITADGPQIPAARRGKNIARAPFISRLIPATTRVGLWAPSEPVVHAARADGLQGQQSRTGHPPDDLLLIAHPGRQRMREHQQPPQCGVVTGPFHLWKERAEEGHG